MSEDLAHGLFFLLLIIMAILEIGLMSVCSHLKDIKKSLQKLTQNKSKGE